MAVRPVKPGPVIPDLAPDVGEAIRIAENRLLKAEQKARAVNDESAEVFAALAAGVGGMYRLTVDATLTMRAALDAVQSVQPPMTAEDVGRLTRTVTRTAMADLAAAVDRLVVQRCRRLAMIAAGVLVAACAASAGVGWYLSSGPVMVAGPSLECHPDAGGTYCGYWRVTPPAAH
jgi:hypothetical protein